MLEWLFRILKKRSGTSKESDEQIMDLERQVQSLKLELEEQKKLSESLKTDLKNFKLKQKDQVAEAVQSQIEQLIIDISTPVTQILTQEYLLKKEKKELKPIDILNVSRRFIGVLLEHKMELLGNAGEVVQFDSNFHEPVRSDKPFIEGESVIVKFAGISYKGRVLRKAFVDKLTEGVL